MANKSETDKATGRDTAWIYVTCPIDWWGGWHKITSSVALPAHITTLIKSVGKILIDHAGWDGKNREKNTWYLSAIPDPDYSDSALILAIKQDNNGTCFIFSQLKLAHLEESEYAQKFRVPFKWPANPFEEPE